MTTKRDLAKMLPAQPPKDHIIVCPVCGEIVPDAKITKHRDNHIAKGHLAENHVPHDPGLPTPPKATRRKSS